jgi:hypothetical protein
VHCAFMIYNSKGDQMIVTTRKLLTFINFEGLRIIIPPLTELWVDTKEGIGIYNEMHFDIYPDEYIRPS